MASWVDVTSVDLVGRSGSVHSGPWEPSVRLRVRTEKPLHPAGLGGEHTEARFPVVNSPLLAIAAHRRFAGLWAVERVSGTTLWCVVPFDRYDDGQTLLPPRFDFATDAAGENLSVKRLASDGATKARMAPPLIFHVRCTVFLLDDLNTVAQTFRSEVQVELRARGMLQENHADLGIALCRQYGLLESMIGFLNVSELLGETEKWTAASNNVFDDHVFDFSFKQRTKG